MSFTEQIIGWLAPPLCVGCGAEGSTLCVGCSESEILPYGCRCWRCGAITPLPQACKSCKSFGGPRRVWLTTQYDGLAKELVQVYKFGQYRAAAKNLSELMVQTFMHPDYLKYLVVPVPTATKRIRERGFGHSELLATLIAKKLDLPSCKALGRLGQKHQIGASRSVRLAQPEGNYYVRSLEQVKGQNILLVDDVLTTGATLRAATKALRAAGAKHVDALVFAKRL
jgi:ComF family protein